ncbi:inner membrane protein [Gammaproteobacteria bacterium]
MEAFSPVFWHWWVIALVMLIVEILAPAIFFVWLAIAAAVVGFAVMVWPGIGWESQLLGFSLLSLVSVVIGRWYFRRHPIHTTAPFLNLRGEQHVGRVARLDKGIVNGQGELWLDGIPWKILGPDCPAGRLVRVTGVDEGTLLRVEISEDMPGSGAAHRESIR